MTDNNITKNEQNTVDTESPVVSTDNSIDLTSFMSDVNTNTSEETLSPLDKAAKESPKILGEVGNTDEIIKDAGPKVFKNAVFNEEREAEFNEKNNELKDLSERAKCVHIVVKPTHQIEDAEMMDELSKLIKNPDGTYSFPEGYEGKYVVPYTKEELEKVNSGEKVEAINPNIVNKSTENEDSDSDEDDEKREIVKIIIDKTGLGNNITFDDEENKYIEKSEEIHIVEVESKELETIVYDRTEDGDSFLDNIDKYQLSVSKTPMVFPGSGFKADMTGLSYGDFADITLDVSDDSEDALDFDKMYKKLTVIYNNMINISCGKFASFTEFLKNFAFIDLPLATFGLLISTQPEIDTVGLKCNNETCGKQFNYKYNIRSLIDFNSASNKYLEAVKQITTCPPEEYVNLHNSSLVRRTKSIKLPHCGYVIDFGLASCYDYLYGLISVLNEYREANMGDDDIRNILITLVTTVRGIRIPQKDGKYIKFTNAKDIIEIMARQIPPQDMQVIYNIHGQFLERYEIEFNIRDIKCPHCGAQTKSIPMTPDELVFLTHQRMLNTPITLDNFLDF